MSVKIIVENDRNMIKHKIKVQQSHNTPMEAQGGVDVKLLLIHDLETTWEEWSASRPGRSFRRKDPGTHCIGGWVGPRSLSGHRG
jgi:hypothetical protein